MKTLWQKKPKEKNAGTDGGPDRTWFYHFTAGEDRELDRQLVPYDILVNMAQARMLLKIGIYTADGSEKVTSALREAWQMWCRGDFDLGPEDEDVHSAVEKFLTQMAGEDGARIHTGRSRNDQVLADMRLFMKDAILEIAGEWLRIAHRLEKLANVYRGVCFAGLTHTQPAMPHSVDAWASGYLDMLRSDLIAFRQAFELIDQSPLGSAAGYGVPHIPVDREFLANELGFAALQVPVAVSQLSRGRFEMQLVDALSYGALSFNRMASDVVLFMHPSWSLVTLSEDQVSGSSIMPQKRNPDAWELIRAGYHDLQANRLHLSAVPANLTSGYHRDLQLVKKSVMSALRQSKLLAEAVRHALTGLEFDREAAGRTLTDDLFATHHANRLVSRGVPFREAYRQVAESGGRQSSAIKPGAMISGTEESTEKKSGGSAAKESCPQESVPYSQTIIETYHHSGAPGTGIPDYILKDVRQLQKWVSEQKEHSEKTKQNLLNESGT